MDTQLILLISTLVLSVFGRIYDMYKEVQHRECKSSCCGGNGCFVEQSVDMKPNINSKDS